MSCQVFGCVCLLLLRTGSCLHAVNCCGPSPSGHCPACSAAPAMLGFLPLLLWGPHLPVAPHRHRSPRTPGGRVAGSPAFPSCPAPPTRPSLSSPWSAPGTLHVRPSPTSPRRLSPWVPFLSHDPSRSVDSFFLFDPSLFLPISVPSEPFISRSTSQPRHGTCEETVGPLGTASS